MMDKELLQEASMEEIQNRITEDLRELVSSTIEETVQKATTYLNAFMEIGPLESFELFSMDNDLTTVIVHLDLKDGLTCEFPLPPYKE